MSTRQPQGIAAAQPDLVLLKSYIKDPLGDTLGSLGYPWSTWNSRRPNNMSGISQRLGSCSATPTVLRSSGVTTRRFWSVQQATR